MSAPKTTGPIRALHQPFSWFVPQEGHDSSAEFLALTKDVCEGIQLCLELVHASTLDHEHNEGATPGNESPPVLSINDMERLMRLSRASAQMLAGEADERIEHINNRRMRERARRQQSGGDDER